MLRAARARALLGQRDYVAPDDMQAILPQTIAHRLVPVAGAGRGRREQVRAMIEAVPLPVSARRDRRAAARVLAVRAAAPLRRLRGW